MNGLALCAIHHLAFDRNLLGIDPAGVVHIADRLLREIDGPMLQTGLQGFHGERISVPRRSRTGRIRRDSRRALSASCAPPREPAAAPATVTRVPAERFVVARNPDPESTLPYLLRLPLDGGIALKAREPWPATARVYCHPLDEAWPAGAEIVEDVAVRQCARRGRAVDLVLDRARRNRSQFVFTEPHADRRGGRPMIFWQTARTARRSRPGQRVPTARATGGDALEITVDSRERYPYKFAGRAAQTRRAALPAGDYAVLAGERVTAAVERKTFEDLVKSLVDGTLGFQLAELSALPAAAVVVEERYGALAAAPRVTAGWPCELVCRLQVRYPAVPIVFADSRKLAEDWTHRFLAAAAAHHRDAHG